MFPQVVGYVVTENRGSALLLGALLTLDGGYVDEDSSGVSMTFFHLINVASDMRIPVTDCNSVNRTIRECLFLVL